ncbi:hypothetical protein BGZ49_010322 [Haplosporangium sp. Z 27]|nr:hypothetical protein BGZ49_010322 [Haplosporangium sp. Z 27]
MFTEDGSIYLVSREVVVVATVVQLVVITFITHLAVLYYYLRQDWQSARQAQDSAGKILSFRDSPNHRHGSNSKATRKWIISSIILVVILVAHYSDKILLFIWTPEAREFTRVAEIDLSIGYNSTIPYDLYQQYGDNKTMMPDMLLDSRYNPVLSQAGVTPSAIHGEEISYFTVDFDKATVLGRDKPL